MGKEICVISRSVFWPSSLEYLSDNIKVKPKIRTIDISNTWTFTIIVSNGDGCGKIDGRVYMTYELSWIHAPSLHHTDCSRYSIGTPSLQCKHDRVTGDVVQAS